VRRALLIAGSLLCALLVAELLLRTFLPQPLVWNTSAIWEPIDGPGWRRRPNLNVTVNTGERTVRVVSDARGHRIGAEPVASADLEILAIGDSFVEALQVDAEQTMTALLAESLSRAMGRSVRVANGGVGGWDANQYLIAAKRELAGARYDLLLVFVFLENDVVARRVDGVPAATVTPPSLSTWLMAHSHLYLFGRNWIELRRMKAGARRHLLTSITRAEASSRDWQVTGDVLADIAAEAGKRQTQVAYILIPPHHYLDEDALAKYAAAMGAEVAQLDVSQPARLLTAELARRGLTVFDATPALARAYHDGRKDLYGRIDRHFSPAGHQVMADFLHAIALPALVSHDGTH
jgi:lysophospholipase L1-like esterase